MEDKGNRLPDDMPPISTLIAVCIAVLTLVLGAWAASNGSDSLDLLKGALAAMTGAGGGVALWIARRRQRTLEVALHLERSHPATQRALTSRIDDLRDNLRTSSMIINEITAELNLQVAALDRIRAEADQNRALAALHKDEADAVKQLVEATIHGAQELTQSNSKRQQWLFFLGGLLLGIPLSMLANFLYDWVK